jgi:hypothetical protein
MRSPETARSTVVLVLVVMAVLFAGLAAWSLAARSAIPLTLDGTVTQVEVREEKHPGVDDVWMVYIDGDPRHLDSELAADLEVGDRIRKDRWETSLVVNDTTRDLALSDNARTMFGVAPLSVLMAALLALLGRRFTSPSLDVSSGGSVSGSEPRR